MIAEPRLATVARRGATVAMGHAGAAGVAPLGERWPHRWVPGRRGVSIGSFMGDILHRGAMVCRLFWDRCSGRAQTGAEGAVGEIECHLVAGLAAVAAGDHRR